MMSGSQVAGLVLALVYGAGAILVAVGIAIVAARRRKAARCSARTVGYVTDHRFNGEGRMAPVIEYEVGGKHYETVRKYSGIITTRSSARLTNRRAWISDRDYLHVQMGAFNNLGEVAETLWPTDSEMEVFYDPTDPSVACAGRRPMGIGVAAAVCMGHGALWVLIGLVVTFLVVVLR